MNQQEVVSRVNGRVQELPYYSSSAPNSVWPVPSRLSTVLQEILAVQRLQKARQF